ncbi:TetR family transcriptional regulator [Streptantibioticus parmotrematis]|uniref:TetR family transcriptional regulator n=1 Tax=Streptantibioticus parmotrematis TaxID=2873249 RepID=UPI0033F45AB2
MTTTNTRAGETRARLLAAARTEFATHGLSGARVDRIAARAGVNKERIYGYFGGKENLFAAVVAETFQEHAERVGLPEGDLGEYAGRVYDFHRRNPELTRMMMWEALHYGGGPMPDDALRTAYYKEKVAALPWPDGEAPDERAAATFLTVIGLAVWPLAFPQMTRLVMGTAAAHSGARDDADPVRAQVVAAARALER